MGSQAKGGEVGGWGRWWWCWEAWQEEVAVMIVVEVSEWREEEVN